MIRFKLLIFAALGVQIIAVWSQDETLTRAAILLTYPLLIIASLANGRLLGMRLILAGALLNFIVIAANGGLMPVSPTTVGGAASHGMIESAPVGEAVPGSKSILLWEHEMELATFADRFVVHLPIIGFRVLSVGDLLIAAGLPLASAQILYNTGSSALGGNRHG